VISEQVSGFSEKSLSKALLQATSFLSEKLNSATGLSKRLMRFIISDS
jgi:hypothetical protein